MKERQSWTAELADAFRDVFNLYEFLGPAFIPSTQGIEISKKYPILIPVSLAEKIKAGGPEGVLAKEFLPQQDELIDTGLIDPIGDKAHLKAPQLIHRYTSRALFTPNSICPVHCRYCFRKNELSASDDLFTANFNQTLDYLKNHQEISEIIFTGGDPLTLSDEKIHKYLQAFAEIPHLKDIRFHTRYPVILPQRITKDFLNLLNHFAEHFRTVTVAIHANHALEFDAYSSKKILELSKLNIQLLSQTVLLKGINDDPESLLSLLEIFINLKIRPYYLHHPDKVKGGTHFYLPLKRGRELYNVLRKKLPGWAIPQYVIDIPGGAGKVSAFNPESLNYSGFLLDPSGNLSSVPEPDFII